MSSSVASAAKTTPAAAKLPPTLRKQCAKQCPSTATVLWALASSHIDLRRLCLSLVKMLQTLLDAKAGHDWQQHPPSGFALGGTLCLKGAPISLWLPPKWASMSPRRAAHAVYGWGKTELVQLGCFSEWKRVQWTILSRQYTWVGLSPGCHRRTPTHDTHTVHQLGSSLTYEHTTSINLKKKIQAWHRVVYKQMWAVSWSLDNLPMLATFGVC